jgi:hypothetical protein
MYYHYSWRDYVTAAKKPKTYRRFLGAIFWQGSEPCNLPEINGLRDEKPRTTAKTRPQDVVFSRAPPCFSAKPAYFMVIFNCQTIE